MFGFIRPVKPELRVKEADRFQQVYCGLCHAIRARYGRFYTFFLSYDMTFFALVAGCGESDTAPPCMKRCDAHPVTKRPCAQADAALETAAELHEKFCARWLEREITILTEEIKNGAARGLTRNYIRAEAPARGARVNEELTLTPARYADETLFAAETPSVGFSGEISVI